MRLTTSSVIPYFDRALTEELGIAIPTNDQKYVRSLIDRARAEFTPKYDTLMIFAPANGEVWLVKRQLERLDAKE